MPAGLYNAGDNNKSSAPMLFNSIEFLLFFLPIVLAGHLLLLRSGLSALPWLLAASLFFYGWWEPRYLVLLVGSATVNFLLAHALARHRRNRVVRSAPGAPGPARRVARGFG